MSTPEVALIQAIDVIANRLDQVKTVHTYRDQIEAAARTDERAKVLAELTKLGYVALVAQVERNLER